MPIRTKHIVAVSLLLSASLPTVAGWYEVTNYEGTIGTYPVHVSIQSSLHDHDEKTRWDVVGSYYYDAKRIPIELSGKQQPDGSLKLCEAKTSQSNRASKMQSRNCPFSLTTTSDGLTGKWKQKKKSYDVQLKTVGQLDNTGEGIVTGKMEVPMWSHSAKYMYLGIYSVISSPISSDENWVVMSTVRAINIATGKVDREASSAKCDGIPGTVYTPIYMNVSEIKQAAKVSIGCNEGKMGHEEVITLKLVH